MHRQPGFNAVRHHAPTEIVVGFEVLPAIVTAWLASMEIAVVPAVWMFNTPLVSAVVTTPAVVDALIDEAIYALQGRGVFCGLTGGVIMLSI